MKRLFSKNKILSSNSGTTLVELVVSMVLTAIFATAVVAVMSPATRIFMQVQDLSRAQIVADIVVDALREECENTYIEDYASARIINPTTINGGSTNDGSSLIVALAEDVKNNPSSSAITQLTANSGNMLLIRKSAGYCETIYTSFPISLDDYMAVHDRYLEATGESTSSFSSKAIYRLFEKNADNSHTASAETNPGYLHFGYYKCGFVDNDVITTINTQNVKNTIHCICPGECFDFTNPFSANAYNGYTIDISFENMTYNTVQIAGVSGSSWYQLRPSGVTVIVKVYNTDFNGQATENPIYTRTARLNFAEDTTK